MIRLNQLLKAIQSKNSGNLGDFAILKADALGAKVDPAVATQLRSVVGYHPPIDLEQLGRLPEGTFGRVYADHMQANQLQSFNVSPELAAVAQRNVFALRYAVTHDIFHVLLGFDTSYAGEIGVLAFAAEQGYSQSLQLSLKVARILYPILAPQQRQAIAANLQRGRELGREAKFLLGYRFEDHWEEPIDVVKAELGLLPQLQEVVS
jgi:ubiquinone biosynthesis protein COQ4